LGTLAAEMRIPYVYDGTAGRPRGMSSQHLPGY
jgi:hypothetical protein